MGDLMKHLPQILALLGASALLAIGQGLLSDDLFASSNTDPYAVTLSSVHTRGPALWVDARDVSAYRESHYPEAVHLTEGNWDQGIGQLLERWEPGLPIVVYCDGEGCAASRNLARRLREDLGITEVYWLEDGWEAMKPTFER